MCVCMWESVCECVWRDIINGWCLSKQKKRQQKRKNSDCGVLERKSIGSDTEDLLRVIFICITIHCRAKYVTIFSFCLPFLLSRKMRLDLNSAHTRSVGRYLCHWSGWKVIMRTQSRWCLAKPNHRKMINELGNKFWMMVWEWISNAAWWQFSRGFSSITQVLGRFRFPILSTLKKKDRELSNCNLLVESKHWRLFPAKPQGTGSFLDFLSLMSLSGYLSKPYK